MCLSRCQQGNIEQDIGPFCQEQMCQGTFQYFLLQVLQKYKGSLFVCKNWIVKRLKFSYTIIVHVHRICKLNLKIQTGRLDTREPYCVIRQEVRIACPYRLIGALFWLIERSM